MRRVFKVLFFIPALILLAGLNIGLLVILVILQEYILITNDYLIWTVNPPTYPVYFLVIGMVDYYIIYLASCHTNLVTNQIPDIVIRWLSKHKLATLLVVVLMLYVIFPNVTTFTETTILHRTFLNPIGVEYTYDDIVCVETGVYGNSSLIRNKKGEYYYIVEFSDGTRVDINSSGSEKGNDSYSMIEYLDTKLMNMGVEKISSLDNIELLVLDQYYIDRFVRIIKN